MKTKQILASLSLVLFSVSAFAQSAVPKSEAVIRGNAIKIAEPIYPTETNVRLQGRVEVEITINEKGDVVRAIAQTDPLLLRASAVKAARESKFKPTLLSGVPVPVTGTLTFEFSPDKNQTEKAEKKEEPKLPDYKQLLERVKKSEHTVDFKELRMSYTETSDYDAYGPSQELLRTMFTAFNDKKYKQAIDQAEKIFAKDYVCIDAHMVSAEAYGALNDKEKSDYHRYVAEGLIDSILKSGKGRSIETAFVVITTGEEYTILRLNGLKPTGQALLHQNGHSYDRLSAIDPKTNEKSEFYFQIDKIFSSWDKIFKK